MTTYIKDLIDLPERVHGGDISRSHGSFQRDEERLERSNMLATVSTRKQSALREYSSPAYRANTR